MNKQNKFKKITEVADNALGIVFAMTKILADNNIVINDLSELVSQLGFIKGLSYVSEEEE